MPALFLLGDLGAVITAAFVTMLALAVGYLLWAIAQAIGSIGIGPFTFRLGHVLAGALDGASSWIVQRTADMWWEIGKLFHATAWIFSQIFGDVVAVVTHLGDQVAHIVTAEIPRAISTATHDAIHYADGVGSSIAGDVNRARITLGRDLSAVARSTYVRLAREAVSIEHDVVASVTHGVDHAISHAEVEAHRLEHRLTVDIATARGYLDGEITALRTDLSRSIATLSDTVAGDYHRALAAAKNDAAAALSTARGLVKDAIKTAEGQAATDVAAARQALQAAIDTTNTTVGALTGTVAANLTATEQYARQQVAAGVQEVTGQLASTAASLESSIGQVASTAAAGIAGAETQTATAVAGALSAADKTLGEAIAGIATDLSGQPVAFGGSLTGIESLLAGAITGAVAGVAARVATLEKCSVGVCENSPNNFSKLLKDALGVADFAGAGAFLAEMINNPAQAEQDYAGLFAGTIGAGITELDKLLAL